MHPMRGFAKRLTRNRSKCLKILLRVEDRLMNYLLTRELFTKKYIISPLTFIINLIDFQYFLSLYFQLPTI